MRLLKAPSSLTLHVSRDGASITSLHNPFVIHHPHRKKRLPCTSSKSPLFQLKTTTRCPVAAVPPEETVPLALTGTLLALTGHGTRVCATSERVRPVGNRRKPHLPSVGLAGWSLFIAVWMLLKEAGGPHCCSTPMALQNWSASCGRERTVRLFRRERCLHRKPRPAGARGGRSPQRHPRTRGLRGLPALRAAGGERGGGGRTRSPALPCPAAGEGSGAGEQRRGRGQRPPHRVHRVLQLR